MNRIRAITFTAVVLIGVTACNPAPASVTRIVTAAVGETHPPAPQAPGPVDDGRFAQPPAPQAPCNAPYPACGRP